MDRRIALTVVGSGDAGKTSSLIAMAYHLTKRGHPVTIVGMDPEPESSLSKLLSYGIPPEVRRPESTIVDILKMPFAKAGKAADDMVLAIEDATLHHPAGFGIISVGIDLVNFEVDGGDILALRNVVEHMTGFVLIDCAAGTGGFSLLSAVAASDYVIGVAKPQTKSIAIAKRACGLELNDDSNFLDDLSLTTPEGLVCNPRYLGMIGNMFVGARLDGGGVKIAESGISTKVREYMNQIISAPGFLGFVPFRTGTDQRDVVKAYDQITSEVLKRIGVTS